MRRLGAEFERQSFIQMVFPHEQSDWSDYLEEACATFVAIIEAIREFEPCLIVCDDVERVKAYFDDYSNIHFVQCETNDTWARDSSGIGVEDEGTFKILDFTFNGWGNKFDASRDNAMTSSLETYYSAEVVPVDFVLEGGAIESDGKGTLLTTSQCLLNPNRNPHLTQGEIESILQRELGVERFLWLHHGYLSGDDTDSHIDTLARFTDESTIVYVTCDDRDDEHYEALKAMESELRAFTCQNSQPYRLLALPMSSAKFYDGHRLPATYANFLIVNGGVIVPTYNDGNDEKALSVIQEAFPSRRIVGVDCTVLIREHGSLHCVTMQFSEKLDIINSNTF